MHAVANTDQLLADGVLSPDQVNEIELRSRNTMIVLAINLLLCGGIVAATGGLIFWLADPLTVAISGTLGLIIGLFIISRAQDTFRMFGNSAAIIGAGMLIGGAAAELAVNYQDIAGWIMFGLGVPIGLLGLWAYQKSLFGAHFVFGSIMVMGAALHLSGLAGLLAQKEIVGMLVSASYLYAAVIIVAVGWATNVRFVTALAIVPFAQMLDTGTFYWHATYAFYSPESTLSIFQMAVLIAGCVWVFNRSSDRTGRHAMVLAVMAFIVANLCALVGALWGDYVGESVWGPQREFGTSKAYSEWRENRADFRETALYISENAYLIGTGIVLTALAFFAAHKNLRGLFNTALTFAGIQAYTRLFENYAEEPLAFVVAGFAAIPLAWGLWRLNTWLTNRDQATA